jgi:alpha-L-rhamnosidase
MKTILFFVSFVLIVLTTGNNWKPELIVHDLKCENLRNPLGIDKTTPRFSWKIKAHKKGTKQTAFQIIVASTPGLLNPDMADLWNPGKIESSASLWILYSGKSLRSGTSACWKVRIWDEAGNASSWSEIAAFSIGLLNKEDWHASYIGFPTKAGYSECPQVKKSFTLTETGKQIFLYVNSLGYHEVWLNGRKVGDGILTPAVSQFDKRSLSVTYEVTSLVSKGENDLVIWLGSGWFTEGLPGVFHNGPLVKAQLENVSENRKEIILITDSSWVGRKSGYTRQGNWRPHQFGGEVLDGTLAKGDLLFEDTPGRNWSPVSVIPVPGHEVTPQMAELNRISEIIKPVEIRPLLKDTFLVDMGKNLTGWFEIHFPKLQKSQIIQIEYCDHLDDQGQFTNQKQSDCYIASGETGEVFCNKFNYHGFRYVRISNLKENPGINSINGYLIHTGYEAASAFLCSDPDLNRIHNMVQYTFRCLSLGGYLVDCPTLERLGYGGDGNASTETAQTMFNLGPLYSNWLQAWADVIREDGGMPHTAPNPYPAGGGPFWCGFIITASWNTFLNYGDTAVLRNYYPVMQHWLEYVQRYSPDGLLKKWPDTNYRGWYLGDWAVPDGVDQKDETSVDLVNNCFMVVCYDNMQKIAGVLGKPGDVGLYSRKKEQLRKHIHNSFFNPTDNSYGTGTQIDLAFPLLARVVPEELTNAVTNNLINETENKRGGHIACGLVGIPVLTEWSVKNHAAGLMYSMLKKKDYPSYLFMLEKGGTTTWEHWRGERSYIHNCYNGIGAWFYQAVGGIRPDENAPAFRKVTIDPQIPQGVTWAKTYKETPYGRISVDWKLKGGNMKMVVEIPVGIEAEIVIPAGIKKYRLDGKQFYLSGEETAVTGIKSGEYKVLYSM